MSLRLRGVRYAHAGTRRLTLDGIDLDVPAGRVVGLVGPSESGKSTLCLVAAGLAPRVTGGRLEGSVQPGGTESAGPRGMVFQNPLAQLSGTEPTVFEEVAFGPRNLGLGVGAVVERVETALEDLGIGHLGPCHPSRLSGGQAQLVALASVLALRPRILVLDQPTAQLDAAGTRRVGDVLARLAARTGTAILLAEHKADLLARVAHEAAVLDGGRLVRRGPPRDVLAAAERKAGPAPRPRTSAARDAVVCEAVSFTYPDGPRALDRVDLRIRQGERLALLGPNGSGKSTLARHLNGLLRPSAGTVSLLGAPLGARGVAELARRAGLMFQHPDRQLFARTVRDEAAFGARNAGLRGRRLDEAVATALEASGLTGEEETHPYDLGASRRKLLALASILAMDTPILVLDEPTAGLDARGIARVQDIIHALAARGRTVIAISHDPDFVVGAFERAVVLRAGRIVFDGLPQDAFAEGLETSTPPARRGMGN
jgi:energy-coupling factor transporter ATP-binding protein EcfA2